MKIKTGLIVAMAAGSVAGIAQAAEVNPTEIAPSGAKQAHGHVYINYHTGERVFSSFNRAEHTGTSTRGAWAGWDVSYPDPCDPNTNTDEQGYWFSTVMDEALGDEPTPNPGAVTAWQQWMEVPANTEFSIISFGFVTFDPDPDPNGSAIPGQNMLMCFTENDRATNRSGAMAHSPIAVTDLPGDVDGANGGTLWFVSVDFDPDVIRVADNTGLPGVPQGVDVDSDGMFDTGFVFTYTQPNVGEGDVLGTRFPELAGEFDGLFEPLDTATFPNILDMGPALGHPSGNAGVDGEPDCYNGTGEWPRVVGCDDVSPSPLGTFDAFGLVDATGTDVGAFFFGGFACTDNGPGLPFNTPWAAPAFAFGIDLVGGPAGCNAADIAEPFGVLDLADIGAFVTGFLAMDPIADLAAPAGVFDLADIGAFVTAFLGGCP